MTAWGEDVSRIRLATLSASAGVALLGATAILHMMAYDSMVSGTPDDLRSLVAAGWVAGGISLILAALLAVAATPLFIVRRRAFLVIAALTPLSIAVLQIAYLGWMPPTGLLLLDGGLLVTSAILGAADQPVPPALHGQVETADR
jgi:hypothetical protein